MIRNATSQLSARSSRRSRITQSRFTLHWLSAETPVPFQSAAAADLLRPNMVTPQTTWLTSQNSKRLIRVWRALISVYCQSLASFLRLVEIRPFNQLLLTPFECPVIGCVMWLFQKETENSIFLDRLLVSLAQPFVVWCFYAISFYLVVYNCGTVCTYDVVWCERCYTNILSD